MMDRIQFRTTKDGVISLTDQIKECVKNSGVKSGIMCAFITHTTAALTVNSFWDPLGHEDIQDEIRRLIPTRVDFKHQHDTPEDAAGHVKCTLIGPSMSFIIEVHRLGGAHCPAHELGLGQRAEIGRASCRERVCKQV